MSEEQKPVGDEPKPVKVKKKASRGLTAKQKKLIKAMIKAETFTEAAEIAGYSDRSNAHHALTNIQEKMPELLDRMGLTDEAMVEQHLKPGLNAMETKFFADKGIVLQQKNVIAWGERRGYLDMFWKLKGKYARDQQDPPGGTTINNTMHINVTVKGDDDLRAILRLAASSGQRSGPGESGIVPAASPVVDAG
jgi:hypothetical protein